MSRTRRTYRRHSPEAGARAIAALIAQDAADACGVTLGADQDLAA